MCACIVGARLWVGPHVVDDAYITFRYSENIASGAGFTYNPPDLVLGTSSPAYALLLTPLAAADVDLHTATLWMAAAADCATAIIGWHLLAAAGWPLAGVVFGILLAFWPGYVTYSVSGLETSLYTLLISAVLLCAARGRAVAVGLLAGGAVLCRPDGALIAAAAVLFIWRQHGIRPAVIAAASATTLLIPWTVFASIYFGSVVPGSVAAKALVKLPPMESLRLLGNWFWRGPYWILTPAAVIGLAIALKSERAEVFRWWTGWWLAYAAVFVITGAFGPYSWYFVPLLPLYFAGVGVFLEAGCGKLPAPAPIRNVLPSAVLVMLVAAGASRLPPLRNTLDVWETQREELYRQIAQRLEPRTCVVAATEIGTLGYFYPGPVLDLVGLVSPGVAGLPTLATLERERPCWIVTYDDLLEAGVAASPAFQRMYEVVEHHRLSGTRSLLVYRSREQRR